ncbi:MAG TPA: bifunctional 4-hydroxy-2-oxoglutarate aldolase/2-dehydro-3-deoxy-phosphogluconate aldolase [Anaerolineales bacterium]|nr:bifunctional 4-hydroxy-2-oxoglutarate aldolase/2-dehydro-3-deoxy-phosphogluconate aldolase [Anaerolineales bacterium]
MKSHYEILQHLLAEKAVAIVRLDSGEQLVRVAEALKAGGITVIEFTFSTPGALDMVKEASAHFGGNILLGAGTVLDPETARAAILAGAEFIVTPTVNLKTISMCKRYGKPIIAGALTPTEMLTVWEAGADLVKVFPASNIGGPDYIKAVLAPLPQLRLVPTGGVSADNAAQYLKAGAAAVAVGGNLVNKKAVANNDWSTITTEAQRLMDIVRSTAT